MFLNKFVTPTPVLLIFVLLKHKNIQLFRSASGGVEVSRFCCLSLLVYKCVCRKGLANRSVDLQVKDVLVF